MLQKEGNALNTEITNAVSAAGDKVQYDTHVKRILAQKNILAHILSFRISASQRSTAWRPGYPAGVLMQIGIRIGHPCERCTRTAP